MTDIGSWIISDKRTGVAVIELFDTPKSRRAITRLNTDTYQVETAMDYLGRINRTHTH